MDNDDLGLILPEEPVLSNNDVNQKLKKRFRCFIFVLEPVAFLVFFGMTLQGAVYQNQLIYQSCKNVFNFNDSECKLLGMEKGNNETKEIEIIVQAYVAKILMVGQILECVIPVICSLFMGPWSDKFGRKPVILASVLGFFLSYLIKGLIVLVTNYCIVNPWAYIMASIPTFFGGTCGLFVGVVCYITDIGEPKQRAYRMVWIEAAIFLGIMLGSLLSSYLLLATNVMVVFLSASFCAFMALLYVIILVDESVKPELIKTGSKLKGLFQLALVKDMFVTCFEKRPNYDRAIIWLCMMVLTFDVFAMNGNATVFYLFVMKKFEWTLTIYTNYVAIAIVIVIIGNIIGMHVLIKVFNFSIMTLALIAMCSELMDSVVKAFATSSWQLYLAVVLGFFKSVLGPMVRTILTQITPISDIGKIMSFTTSLESLTPLCAAPLYTLVYSTTIRYNPAFYNFISIIAYVICYIGLVIIYGLKKLYATTSTYSTS